MAAVNPRNLVALLNLAWRTFVHFITYPLRPRSRLPDIVRAYALNPRPVPPAAVACVGCGECTAVMPDAPALILRLGREVADIPFAQPARARLLPVADAITRMCPHGADINALLTLTKES